ncbi:MAG: amidohydrolase family protein, partial [Deltaproteobacteria bacterium]|nr:amidohydrolase family protein [Deltaproteobacteria bacterium]
MAEPVKTIYVNGDIVSLDNSNRRCQALATSGDRILALGSNEEIKTLATTASKVVNLDGKTVLPGFIDPHGHFFLSCYFKRFFVDLNSPPIGDITSIDDIQTKLKETAAKTAPGKWITGFGYDDTMIAEQRHPTRYDLDK